MSASGQVTFILPAYNAAATLPAAVASLVAQTSPAWRLVIVDDASTDDTLALARSLAAAEPRITVLAAEHNIGAGAARNLGLEAVETQYLGFLDADDTVEPDLVERVLAALAEHPVDVVVFGLVEDFVGAGGALAGGRTIVPPPAVHRDAAAVRAAVLPLEEQTLFGYQWNRVYRTGLIQEHGIRFEHARLYEDYFFNLAVIEQAHSQLQLDFAPYHYVKGQTGSVTSTPYIEQYYALSMRRIRSLRDALLRWGLLDAAAAAGLGTLYLRYLLSATARNADPASGYTRPGQELWLASACADELWQDVGMRAKPRSLALRSFQQLLLRERFGAAVRLAAGARRLRDGARPVYERLTRWEAPRVAAVAGPGRGTRVLVFGMTHNPGGIESYLINRFRTLQHDDLTFDFVCDWPTMAYHDEVSAAGSHTYFIPAKGTHPLGHLLGWARLLRAHPEYRTVYLQAMDAGVGLSALVPKLMGRRVVLHSHNSATDRSSFHRRFMPLLRRVVDDRFACSADAAEYMFGTREGVGVIHNAIDLEAYRFDAARRVQVREALDLGERTVVLTVGRMTPQKNSLRLPAMMQALVAADPSAVLLWVGQGELEAEARAEVSKRGLEEHVRFLGIRDDVADLMQAADVFLLPSRFEGLAFVLIEAQASGLPGVVSTAVAPESSVGGLRFVLLTADDAVWAQELLAQARAGRLELAAALAEKGFDVRQPDADTHHLLEVLAEESR